MSTVQWEGCGSALHRANRDALCVGGQERRRVVEAQEEAEEAHAFERQSEEGSIILSSVRWDEPIELSSATISPSMIVSSGIGASAFTMPGYRVLKSLSFRERSCPPLFIARAR